MKKIAIALCLTVLLSGCIGQQTANPYQMDYAEKKILFRSNLIEAAKVSIEPSEMDLQLLVLSPYTETIRIAFVPSDSNNKFYAVTGAELAQKLKWVRMANYGQAIPIKDLILNTTEDAKRLATISDPIILIQAGNETKVVRERYVVYLTGKDMTENKRDYTDLDLAADKFLLVLMDAGYQYKLVSSAS